MIVLKVDSAPKTPYQALLNFLQARNCSPKDRNSTCPSGDKEGDVSVVVAVAAPLIAPLEPLTFVPFDSIYSGRLDGTGTAAKSCAYPPSCRQ
jgi:hypothetical protein